MAIKDEDDGASGSLNLVTSDFGDRGFTASVCEAVRMAMSTGEVGNAAGLLDDAGAFGACV